MTNPYVVLNGNHIVFRNFRGHHASFFCLEANMKIGYGITESATRRRDENDT